MTGARSRGWSAGRRAGAILLCSLCSLAASLAWPSGSASAHPVLVRSEPSRGARLETAPPDVRLWFSEVVEARYARIEAGDAAGCPIGDPGRRSERLRVIPDEPNGLARRLAFPPGEGRYRIAWRALSRSDGHVVTGEFDFTVGDVAAALGSPALPPGAPDSAPEEVPLRIAVSLAAAWLVGGAVFRRVVLLGSPVAVPMAGAAGALALASLLSVGAWAMRAAPTPADLPGLLGLPLGRILLARLLLAAVVLVVALRGRGVLWPGLAFLATLSAGSHSAATGDPLSPVVDWLHLVAGAVWAGGLGHLAWLARRSRRPEQRGPELWGPVARRFSRLAMVATAALAATGLYRAAQELGGAAALTATASGRLITAKGVLFLAALAVGGWHLRLHLQGSQPRSDPGPARFRRSLLFELGLLYLAFAAAGLLTAEPPGRLDPAVNVLSRSARAGEWVYELELRPGWVGPNEVRLRVDPRAPSEPTRARLALGIEQHPGHTVWVEEVPLRRIGPGEFAGRAERLAVSWKAWRARAVLSTGGAESVGATTFPLLEPAVVLTPGPPIPWRTTVAVLALSAGAGVAGRLAWSRARRRRGGRRAVAERSYIAPR